MQSCLNDEIIKSGATCHGLPYRKTRYEHGISLERVAVTRTTIYVY